MGILSHPRSLFVYTLSLFPLSYVHPSILIVTLGYMPYKHLMEVIYSVKHICYYTLVENFILQAPEKKENFSFE